MTTQANRTPGTHPHPVEAWVVPQAQHSTPRKCNLLLLVLAACSLMAASEPIEAANLLVNSGFETGNLHGWSVSPTTNGAVTTAQAHNGTYSMEMQAVDFIYQTFTKGDKVHAKLLRLYAKAASYVGGPADAKVTYADGTVRSVSLKAATSAGWTKFTIGLDPGKEAITEVRIELGETPSIYVDDVQLIL